MVPMPDALRMLGDHTAFTLNVVSIPWDQSVGRVLAEDVNSCVDIPPYDASIVDGYAAKGSLFSLHLLNQVCTLIFRFKQKKIHTGLAFSPLERAVADLPTAEGGLPVSTPVVASKLHASKSRAHSPGTLTRITTGARVPDGAEAVVMVENTKLVKLSMDGEELTVAVPETTVSVGENIRKKGSDVATGARILSKGVKMGPAEIGILAACGVKLVSLFFFFFFNDE
jgi:gephyrin